MPDALRHQLSSAQNRLPGQLRPACGYGAVPPGIVGRWLEISQLVEERKCETFPLPAFHGQLGDTNVVWAVRVAPSRSRTARYMPES